MSELEIKGRCCACGKEKPLRNFMCIAKRHPTPGKGWGCVVCEVPPDGAVAAICDDCLESQATIVEVCAGYPPEAGRVPLSALTEPFDHDWSKHKEEIADA